jgi:ATP-dependent helicase/nuclease subunit A
MNLHKAKGLEASVVVLADPAHTYDFPITARIVREGAVARGHLRLVRKGERNRHPRVLGQGAGWDAHEQEEARYVEAERIRLLYVAGTRARECLVVCRLDDPKKNKAWKEFEPHLRGVPPATVAPGLAPPAATEPDWSPDACAAAARAREAAHEHAREPSWSVATPTGTASRATMPARARLATGDVEAAAAVPETPTDRADAGAAWGTLVHGLLEHAMRHRETTRRDLARLALWLTVESPELRPFVDDALDLVESVAGEPFWHEARAAAAQGLEVPFAVRIEPGAQMPGLEDVAVPTILHGVIDLVHTTAEGWRIVDYKTDRLDGVADIEGELWRRHGVQLAQYQFAWERVAGGATTARIVRVRTPSH